MLQARLLTATHSIVAAEQAFGLYWKDLVDIPTTSFFARCVWHGLESAEITTDQ